MEAFIDDFSIFGDSFPKYLHHLNLVLTRCKEKNLTLKWEKCPFMVQQGIFMGHVISKKGIQVNKVKVNLIASLPRPNNVKDIRSFLGHASFIDDLSRTSARLLDP